MGFGNENVGFVKQFCANPQKVKSFSDENDNKYRENSTFAIKVLYYAQNIGK